MGIAFQIVDDVLDVVGHPDLLGKPIGMDLRDGNPSLPIILAMEDPLVREAFERTECEESRITAALEAIKRGPNIERAKDLSRRYAETALASLEKVPPSAYHTGLKTLVRLIIDRDF